MIPPGAAKLLKNMIANTQYIVLPMLATMRIILLEQMVTLTQKCQTGNGALLPDIL